MNRTARSFGPYTTKHLEGPLQNEQWDAESVFSPTPWQTHVLALFRERRDDFSAAAVQAGLIDHPPETQAEFEKVMDYAKLLGIRDVFAQDWDFDAGAELASSLQALKARRDRLDELLGLQKGAGNENDEKACVVTIRKKLLRTTLGLSKSGLRKWLKEGKIVCLKNERQRVTLDLNQFEPHLQERIKKLFQNVCIR